jgi:hypothetical protein
MAVPEFVVITGAVEGDVDEAVVRCLIEHIQAKTRAVYGRNGKSHLQRRLSGYNQAARFSPWIVLVDLDHDAECAPPFRNLWLPDPSQYMCFRVAVHAVEAWLMADRERLARFLAVNVARIPENVEAVHHPKPAMVEIAKHSRRREIREDMVPRAGSGRVVGPAYTARLIEFVIGAKIGWRPEVAAECSESLKRCLRCLRRLKEISA